MYQSEPSTVKARRIHPFERASFFSKYFYWWLKDVLKMGLTRPINEDDIYETVSSHKSGKITDRFELLWEEEVFNKTNKNSKTKKNQQPKLLNVMFRAYGWPVILFGLFHSIIESAARIGQPLCLGGLITYFTAGQTEISKHDAYLYAAGIILGSALPLLIFHPFMLYIFQVAMKIRCACCSMIYRKVLGMSKSNTKNGIAGQVINLMSNDVSTFDWAISFIQDLWKGPFETILIGYFIYREMGYAGLVGLVFLLAFIPLQAWFGKISATIRYETAERTDTRVRFMNEIIQGIQTIKMYAWEKSFAELVNKIRSIEMRVIRKSAYISATLLSFSIISRISIYLSLVTFVIWGNIITARKVFILISFFNILSVSMVQFWPLAITSVAGGLVSVRRVEEFLLSFVATPKKGKNSLNGKIDNLQNTVTPGLIQFSNVNALWDLEQEETIFGLSGINLKIMPGETCAIIGQVGSGKTTLLNAILGELEVQSGLVQVGGAVSYASQETWLFEGTIRSNIVFIENYDEKRYQEVISVCSLERDLELFPSGDKTVVGERGVSLSGGQKARVNLARAIYKRADIYLLDDPLSAVDAHVAKHIFTKCIEGFLMNKTCVLITHQLQFLHHVEHVIVMAKGRIEAEGSFNNLKSSGEPILHFWNDIDHEIDEHIDNEEIITKTKKKKKVECEDATIHKEGQETGSVGMKIYGKYLHAVNNIFYVIIILALFLLAQAVKSGIDFFVSIWVNWEETQTSPIVTTNIDILTLFKAAITSDEFWTRHMHIYFYSGGIVLLIYLTLHRSFAFFQMCLRASMHLHDKLFRGVTQTFMQFFYRNSSGRILNRFSRDIGLIDTNLPMALVDTVIFFLEFLGIITVVSIVNFWLLIPTIFIVVFFYALQHIFLKTARNVKRVEAITRSPIYSHTNATLQGLTTIRAFNAEKMVEHEFDNHQDLNTSASFLFLATTRGFAFWLDLVCIFYIAVVTMAFFILGNDVMGGNVGLSITQVISLIGMCNWGLRQSAELENQMTSVERVLEYTELPSEPLLEFGKQLSTKWPHKGVIIFDNLKLRYGENNETVLKGLNFKIESEEKIGIVGRTGSGKSSIIQALFRLANIDGNILIDNVDTATLCLQELRSRISIIPQDPVLFSQSLRSNLDPFGEKRDHEIWHVLELVELKEYILQFAGGLDTKISDGGGNLSMGQRQLVCLARAILRDNHILILDEATANVDKETDHLIQQTIRAQFKNCTVLTIAHRLDSIMDSDRVMVMDAGQIVEFDKPENLLHIEDGYFHRLVHEAN